MKTKIKNAFTGFKTKVILAFGGLVFVMSGLAFIGQIAVLIPYSRAEVQEKENLLIFAYCKPVATYDILGTVKLPALVGSERADRVLETLIKRAKKDFPSSQALILNPEMSKAECVKFHQAKE